MKRHSIALHLALGLLLTLTLLGGLVAPIRAVGGSEEPKDLYDNVETPQGPGGEEDPKPSYDNEDPKPPYDDEEDPKLPYDDEDPKDPYQEGGAVDAADEDPKEPEDEWHGAYPDYSEEEPELSEEPEATPEPAPTPAPAAQEKLPQTGARTLPIALGLGAGLALLLLGLSGWKKDHAPEDK